MLPFGVPGSGMTVVWFGADEFGAVADVGALGPKSGVLVTGVTGEACTGLLFGAGAVAASLWGAVEPANGVAVDPSTGASTAITEAWETG